MVDRESKSACDISAVMHLDIIDEKVEQSSEQREITAGLSPEVTVLLLLS